VKLAMKKTKLLENVARIYYHVLLNDLDIDELPDGAIYHFANMRKSRFHSWPLRHAGNKW